MNLGKKHLLLPLFALALLGGARAGATADWSAATRDSSVLEKALRHRKAALEIELRLVRADRDARYLVIDLPEGAVQLKSGAYLLRTCPVQGYRRRPGFPERPILARLVGRIDPVTPEPGNGNLRLRGRHFPLDFVGRLVEGPRMASRLYFVPSLVVQPSGLSPPFGCSDIELAPGDIKALGAALHPGTAAILIPPLDIRSDRGAPQ